LRPRKVVYFQGFHEAGSGNVCYGFWIAGRLIVALSDTVRLVRALFRWYGRTKRDLPWRGERDPYRILVSEVLTQQTRIDQAVPYYHRFLKAFPDFDALARARQERVLKTWEGAGYYARARNLHRLAREVFRSGLPETYDELLHLPGLGPYTAAAVASIAFGQRVAAVDGNVRRVLARLHSVERPSTRWLDETARALLPRRRPGDWNQALMELGARVCLPKRPQCPSCPLRRFCRGRSDPGRYPKPVRRTQRQVRAAALVLEGVGGDGYVLERRLGRSLSGLWGFPLEEGRGAAAALKKRFRFSRTKVIGTVRHQFTHKDFTVTVHFARTRRVCRDPARLPLSRLDQKILKLVRTSSPD
jgi:A/G-specific adenine glycosylase